jgi:parallel beta-helix repeat protein
MKRSKMFTPVALAASSLLLIAVSARAENISGTITTTRVITENSQLVGDVTCMVQGAACIQFGASGITLNLNGFTMTGLADPNTGCAGTSVGPENGINTAGQSEVTIQGPGMVLRFRNQGILVNGGSRVRVVQVTGSNNCASGLILTGGSVDNHVEANVFTRNGNTGAPCGGICIAATSRNRIFRNQTSGNGYSDQSGVAADDFGIGIVTPASTGNMIEENSALGNSNGIFLVAGTSGNVIRRNVVMGNPAIQVSNSLPMSTGVDIRNLAAAGANMFEDNACVTSMNAPCPSAKGLPVTQPIVTGITFDPATVRVGGSFIARFSGSNLTSTTYFDVRFRQPGSSTDEVATDWQQGTSAAHAIAAGSASGVWVVTGVRAHQALDDHSGAFVPILANLTISAF